MNHNHTPTRHGFTLLELLAAILVMSIISAVVLPVIMSASESYTTTRDVRTRTERMGYALDRITRMIRQAPIGVGDTGVGIQSATSESLVFTDGTGFDLSGNVLRMRVPNENPATLCDDIDAIEVVYLDSDGVTSTLGTPADTHRVVVTLTSGNLQMSTVAHPRVWIGQEGTP